MTLPRERATADHRVLGRIFELSFGVNDPKEEILTSTSKLFTYAGGSWVRFFEGHPDHVRLLKRSAKAIFKKQIKNKKK